MSGPWLCGNGERWIPFASGVYNLLNSDLMTDYKAWNIANIRMLFPDQMTERIIATPLISSVYENRMV
jgi:hypothetical protein